MADEPVERNTSGQWLDVDGRRVDLAGWHLYPHRWAGGAFTTGYDQLRRLLPSPPLYPVRVSRNRALVCAWGAYVPAAGHGPPFLGYGEVAMMAFVTSGEKPAPPLVPGLGRWATKRFGFGFFPLMTVVTNRAAAELYRLLFGSAAAVADIRVEQRLGRERFVCHCDGRLVWDLAVRSDGRPSAEDPGAANWFHAVEDGDVYRVPIRESGISRSRFGRKSASLIVGDHPLAEPARRLTLSPWWAGEFMPDRQLSLGRPVERLGPAGRGIEPVAVGEATRARLVVSPTPGVEFDVDQGLDGLGWDPEGVFTGPTLQERSVAARPLTDDVGGKG